jgi:hypothetical protein
MTGEVYCRFVRRRLIEFETEIFYLDLITDGRGKNKRFSVRFETWMWNCWICKWMPLIISQELSIKRYPKQVGSYLSHHFNTITIFTQVHKIPFHSSVPLISVTLNMVTFPYQRSQNTFDEKCFKIFTQPYSKLDDATMCRAVRGILSVTMSDVCLLPLYTDVDRSWKYQCLKLNYIPVSEKWVSYRYCVF